MKAQRLHSILAKLHRVGAEATGLRVPLAQLHKPLLNTLIAALAERPDWYRIARTLRATRRKLTIPGHPDADLPALPVDASTDAQSCLKGCGRRR
ncbi:hypothetical protein LJR267_009671 [Paraburkholderia hospita]|uniref:hypothetical protein n=1 Tax=Paraburkholderia hospita TaxID=169430 RepID=UPI003ECD57E8